jgi:hypothetical protein
MVVLLLALARAVSEVKNKKRIPFFKNEPRRLLKTKDRAPKTKLNEPENEAGKLSKTRSCGKNEPKNEPGHVVDIKGKLKNETKNEPEISTSYS